MNIRYKQIRKVIITGTPEEMHRMIDWAYDNAYHIIYRGPSMKRDFTSKPNTFKVVAEKEGK